MPERQHGTWGELMRDAVQKPGRMLEAYTAFHNYSFGNALLALEQCSKRNLQPGPLNTYRGWLEKKQQVRKGEKGITLCMPMPFKRAAQPDDAQDETAEPQVCYASGFGRIGLYSHRLTGKRHTFRRFPVLTSRPRSAT